MGNWWDDLPDGSVMLVKGEVHGRVNGRWWHIGGDWPVDEIDHTDAEVIYVPVTDIEPPYGSIVMAGPESYWEHIRPQNSRPWADPWDLGCQPKSWDELRPNVTRILRWGE